MTEDIEHKFITFEGIEGSGKSTHSKLIADFLKEEGFPVVYTREPGGVPISEMIRKILLEPKNAGMSQKCELLLYMASRAELVSKVIKPALEKNKIVVCDRFLDATVCYQGYGSGLNIDFIKKIGNYVTNGLEPNLTIFLDTDVNASIKSIKNPDRIEKRNLDYHNKVRNGYLQLANKFPNRIKTVKVQEEINDTQDRIRKIISKFLRKH